MPNPGVPGSEFEGRGSPEVGIPQANGVSSGWNRQAAQTWGLVCSAGMDSGHSSDQAAPLVNPYPEGLLGVGTGGMLQTRTLRLHSYLKALVAGS